MSFVSVIIPAYQNAATIVEAVTSVLNQTMKDVEIIIIDDGSTDNLEDVLRPLVDKIIFLRQENQGSAAARNLGIKNSTGEFVAFLDADDKWFPEKLTLQLALFEKNTKVGLVFGNMKYLYEGNVLSTTYFDLIPPLRGKVFLDLFAYNFVPTSATMVRRQVLEQVGLFDESFRIVQDYHLWLRIASSWELDYIEAPVTIYRTGTQQISRNLVKAATMLLQVKKDIYSSYIGMFEGADRKILERGLYDKYLRLAMCHMREAQKEEANQVVDSYYQVRGFTFKYFIFRAVLILPARIVVKIIQLLDKFRQKPQYAFY